MFSSQLIATILRASASSALILATLAARSDAQARLRTKNFTNRTNMNVLKRLADAILDSRQPWWVEVQTQAPECTYYFGPFDSKKEAEFMQMGYVEDLVQEGAQNVSHTFKKTQPDRLTSCQFE